MDNRGRQITKIAREAEKLTIKTMKEEGIGTGEFDLIHAVRHNPGLSQKEICLMLNMDKGAAAHRTAALEQKGYLTREDNPQDKRSRLLFATRKSEGLKISHTFVESEFYKWLLNTVSDNDRIEFERILNVLYENSKEESRAGFPHVLECIERERNNEREDCK